MSSVIYVEIKTKEELRLILDAYFLPSTSEFQLDDVTSKLMRFDHDDYIYDHRMPYKYEDLMIQINSKGDFLDMSGRYIRLNGSGGFCRHTCCTQVIADGIWDQFEREANYEE